MGAFAVELRMKVIIVAAVFVWVSFSGTGAAEEKGGDFDVSASQGLLSKSNVQWHGYYEFEYWEKENAEHSFDAHKLTVWMGIPINEKVFLSSEIEYEHFPRLRDNTQRDGESGEIKVDSAALRITPTENFSALAGIFYVPFGIEYFSYPGQKNKLITRPKLMKSGGIIPGTWSDVGIGVNHTVSGIGQADFFLINGDAKNGGISRDSSAGGNENKSFGGRIQLDNLKEGLNIGGSFVTGRWDEEDRNISYRTGAHLQLGFDKLTGIEQAPSILGEFVTGYDEANSSVSGMDKQVYGFYTQISSTIVPKVQLAVRYGLYDNDKEKVDNLKTEISFGVVYQPWDYFQVKAEYQINEEKKSRTVRNNLAVLQLVAFW